MTHDTAPPMGLCYDECDISEALHMAVRCFRLKGSDPPVCGVHNVELVLSKISLHPHLAPNFGLATCLICPVSQFVVD